MISEDIEAPVAGEFYEEIQSPMPSVVDAPVSNLPVPIGIRAEHRKINHEFVERLMHMLQGGDIKLKSYAIDEEYYGGQVKEAVALTVGSASISVTIIQDKN